MARHGKGVEGQGSKTTISRMARPSVGSLWNPLYVLCMHTISRDRKGGAERTRNFATKHHGGIGSKQQ